MIQFNNEVQSSGNAKVGSVVLALEHGGVVPSIAEFVCKTIERLDINDELLSRHQR